MEFPYSANVIETINKRRKWENGLIIDRMLKRLGLDCEKYPPLDFNECQYLIESIFSLEGSDEEALELVMPC
jgi:hypothetical protein